MKLALIIICFFTCPLFSIAQNIGINNPNPLFPLTFNANLGDKIALWTDGTPTHYGFGIQSGVLQMFSKTNLDDIAFGYGSSNSFVEAMRIKGNGRVGIGTSNPNAPLGFPAAIGKKITLYPGATGDVGMAVQGNLLQIYADHPNADIAFGYDQGGTMTERMRIKGNGNVGIGTNSPQYPLDINGRMRLSGTSPFDPGIWFNDAGLDRAFVGLENNNYIGFYGAQAGWRFTMNTQTGALKVNGSEGQAGQVLQSGGSGVSPNWSSVSSWLFNNIHQITQTAPVTITSTATIPGMHYADYSVVVTSTSKMILSFDAKIESIGCFGCAGSFAFFQTYISRDGNAYSYINGKGDAGNAQLATVTTGIAVLTVPPGTYTFFTFGANHGGPAIRFTDGKLLVVVIPQ